MKKELKQRLKLALINAAIAGLLVFFGSFTSGIITMQGLCAALAASVIIFLTRIRDSLNKKGLLAELFVFI